MRRPGSGIEQASPKVLAAGVLKHPVTDSVNDHFAPNRLSRAVHRSGATLDVQMDSAGRIENAQVGVYPASGGHAFIDRALYLPSVGDIARTRVLQAAPTARSISRTRRGSHRSPSQA